MERETQPKKEAEQDWLFARVTHLVYRVNDCPIWSVRAANGGANRCASERRQEANLERWPLLNSTVKVGFKAKD